MQLQEQLKRAIESTEDDEEALLSLRCFSTLEVCQGLKAFIYDNQHLHRALDILVSVCCRSSNFSEELFFITNFICKVDSDPSSVKVSHVCSLFQHAKDCNISCSGDLFDVVLERIIMRYDAQGEVLAQRRRLFMIMEFILTVENIPRCDKAHLKRILSHLDGERNPDLVYTLLVLVKRLCDNANSVILEEMSIFFFDLAASYFPIVLSQTQKATVPKKGLQDALRECMIHPVFGDHCLPFLLLRINSPSQNVKKDVLETINAFLLSQPKISVAQYKEIISVIRSEAKKVSLSEKSSKDVFSLCCAALEIVSKKCVSVSNEDILSLFSPVAEDVFESLNNFETTQINATLISHIFQGSWSVCVELCPYLCAFIVGMNTSEVTASELTILAAIFTSVTDVIVSTKPNIEVLNEKVDKMTIPLLKFAEEAWERLSKSIPNEFTLLCTAEFLIAFLQFHFFLQRNMQEVTRKGILLSLMESTKMSSYAGERVAFLLSKYAAVDWPNTEGALEHFMKTYPSAILGPSKCLFITFGACCSASAASVITLLMLRSSTESIDERRKVVEGILADVRRLEDDDARKILQILKRSSAENSFSSLCFLFSKCSEDFCHHELISWKSHSLTVLAALLNRRHSHQFGEYDLESLIDSFLSLASEEEDEKRRVGLNGLTGCYISLLSAGKSIERSFDECSCICYLWTESLFGGNSLPKIFVEQCFSSIFSSSVEKIIELFSFKPVYHRESSNNNNTLLRYVLDYVDYISTISSEELLSSVLLRILSLENVMEIAECLSLLLHLLRTGRISNERLILVVLLSVSRSEKERQRIPEILSDPILRNTVFRGVESGSLSERCAVLDFLREVGEHLRTTQNTLWTCMKGQVLCHTLLALNDRKRVIRQAAAKCRHVWFLLH